MSEAKYTDGYEVTRDGKVYSIAHNWRGYGKRELQQTLNADGYPSVRLAVNGRRIHYKVHVLVAQEYLGQKPSPLHQVCHNDGNRLNNAVSNLRWGTAKDNAEDRARHVRTSRGVTHADAVRLGVKKSQSPYYTHNRC